MTDQQTECIVVLLILSRKKQNRQFISSGAGKKKETQENCAIETRICPSIMIHGARQ